MGTERKDGPAGIDFDEVTRLVDALEQDLAKVREGSSDIATLRSEVDQLRSALRSAEPARREVHSGLENVRDILHRAGDELIDDAVKVGDYVTRIGTMLGL
jgi:multidrug resistance efflux pump